MLNNLISIVRLRNQQNIFMFFLTAVAVPRQSKVDVKILTPTF